MIDFFISYTSIDRSWAEWIAWQLEEAGYTTVLQAWDFRPGTNFVVAMQHAAANAERMIAILSPDYLDSRFTLPEWAIAFAQDPTGEKGLLLPVRVRDCEPRGLLPQIVYIDIVGQAETDARDVLLAGVPRKRAKPQTAPGFPGVVQHTLLGRPPFPETTRAIHIQHEIKLEVGTLDPASPFYIKRPADTIVERQLQRGSATITIKGPRQFGKSSLLARTHASADQTKRLSCYIDLQSIDGREFENLDRLCRALAREISEELTSAVESHHVWTDNRGAKENLTRFMERVLQSRREARIQILFDEADRVFSYPSYRDEFFAMLRVWHNRRATHANRGWQRLDILIAHSTDPTLWIRDLSQSPFNVGIPLRLEDFDSTQIGELNCKYGDVLKSATEVQELMDLVGGHPFLVHQSLYILAASNCSVVDLQHNAMNQGGPFADHMKYLLQAMQEDSLKDALRQIIDSGSCQNEVHFQRLWSAGVVDGPSRDTARVRCQLYRDYLSKHL